MASTATVPRETNGAVPPPATSAYAEVPLNLIAVGTNVRAAVGDLDELVASVKVHGILQPIRVAATGDGAYELVYGQRRLAAAKLAGLATIPAIVDVGAKVASLRTQEQLVENLQRRDLNPLEEAKALRSLLDADPQLTQEAIADRIGRSRPWVSNALRILDLADEVQAKVADGTLTAAHVKAIGALPKKEQVSIAKRVAATGLSSHQVENEVKWARQQAYYQRKQREQRERSTKTALAAVEKAKVPKTALLYVGYDQTIGDALKKAGWKKVKTGYYSPEAHEDCDAPAFRLAGAKVQPACGNDKHREALAAKARADVEEKEREEALRALEAIDVLVPQLVADPRRLARFAAYILLDDHWSATARAFEGEQSAAAEPPAQVVDGYALLTAMPDDQVARWTARVVIEHFQEYPEADAVRQAATGAASTSKPAKTTSAKKVAKK